MRGRVGDTPIIGAGNYADNATCAVSGTGDGEYFIRNLVAYDIAALVKYQNLPLDSACREVVFGKLGRMKARGGVIALDRQGHMAMVFNTEGMYRGYALPGGTRDVKIYGD
jgi:beta-aspartyl-peptidase (threonine type)